MIPADNRILRSLPAASLARLLPDLRPTALKSGQVLCEAGQAVAHAYFPVTGLVSLVAVDGEAEVGLSSVGREGVAGLPHVYGDSRSTFQVIAPAPGTGWTLDKIPFQAEFVRGGHFQAAVLAQFNVQTRQVQQSNLCNVRHTPEGRLSHILLLLSDRLGTLELEAATPSRARAMGVQSLARTDAFAALRADGLVDHTGDRIVIVNRAGLEARACTCYHRLTEMRSRLRALKVQAQLEIARTDCMRASRARLWADWN